MPGTSATWGWVKPNNRMVVYPQLTNPNVNLSNLPNNNFPITENFTATGKSMFGRPKFNRSVVKSFSPSAPGGDGKALFMTDKTNYGTGTSESVTVGKPGHRTALAVEPMTCAPDAFNADRYDYDAGLIVLEPGASASASWRICAIA